MTFFDYDQYERDYNSGNLEQIYNDKTPDYSEYPIMDGLTRLEYGTPVITEGIGFAGSTTMAHEMWLVSRDAPTPEEQQIHLQVPYRQGYIDFSERNGERVYNPRQLTYVFYVFDKTYEQRKLKGFDIRNWLMNASEQPLYDTHDAGYFFEMKCQSVHTEDDAKNQRLILTVTFVGQPFLKSEKLEGDDIWDEIDFELDYFQEPQITLKPYTAYSSESFIPQKLGEKVHIGAWSQYIGGSQTPEDVLSVAYPIEDIRNTGTTSDVLRSTKQYLLGVLNVWVYEQDIIEALPPQEITLYNTGVHKVLPEVMLTWVSSGSAFDNISVSLDGKISHIKMERIATVVRQGFNKTLFLKPGENKLKVYGYGWKVDFQWRREVL